MEQAEAAPWQTKSRWQSELAEICKCGEEERLRDLCCTFHLKRKHLEEPFARSFPEAVVLNSKLEGSQPRKVLIIDAASHGVLARQSHERSCIDLHVR